MFLYFKHNSNITTRILDYYMLVSGEGGVRVSDVTRGEGIS